MKINQKPQVHTAARQQLRKQRHTSSPYLGYLNSTELCLLQENSPTAHLNLCGSTHISQGNKRGISGSELSWYGTACALIFVFLTLQSLLLTQNWEEQLITGAAIQEDLCWLEKWAERNPWKFSDLKCKVPQLWNSPSVQHTLGDDDWKSALQKRLFLSLLLGDNLAMNKHCPLQQRLTASRAATGRAHQQGQGADPSRLFSTAEAHLECWV